MTELIFIFIVLGTSFAFIFYYSFVFWILWGWFMVPFGLPEINLAWAIGFTTVISILMPVPPPTSENKKNQYILISLTKPIILLFLGFIAKSFM